MWSMSWSETTGSATTPLMRLTHRKSRWGVLRVHGGSHDHTAHVIAPV